jgi:hypothetical protein
VSQDKSTFSGSQITHHPCPGCALPMRYVAVSVYDDEHDLQTFRCVGCEQTERVVFKCEKI